MTAMEEFMKAASRLHNLTSTKYDSDPLRAAQRIAADWRRRAEAIDITARSVRYEAMKAIPEDIEAAKIVREGFYSLFEARGIKEQSEALLAISREIEGLRAVLPSLAAKAAIEAGVIARKLAQEAHAE